MTEILIGDRLRELRKRAGYSVRGLAKEAGLPDSTYASYENKYKKSYLPIDLIHKIKPLLMKKGIEESEILELSGVSKISEDFTKRQRKIDKNIACIEELDVRASAGPGQYTEAQEVIAEWQMPSNLIAAQTTANANSLKIITVYGDSMAPDFLPGERVMVDISDRLPSPPGVFVVWDGFALIIKRLEMIPYSDPPKLRAKSSNKEYETFELELSEITINGRVVGKWKWT